MRRHRLNQDHIEENDLYERKRGGEEAGSRATLWQSMLVPYAGMARGPGVVDHAEAEIEVPTSVSWARTVQERNGSALSGVHGSSHDSAAAG
eukprot:2637611-Pleurochrysis_carterae.AAC.3